MKLAELLEARTRSRPCVTVALSDIIAEPIEGSFVMRALTADEEHEATAAAVTFRKSTLSSLPEAHATAFLNDASFLEDAKWVERLWRSARSADDHDKPAFESAAWVRKNFTPGELSVMVEWYRRAESLMSKTPEVLTLEQRRSLRRGCAMMAKTDFPDRILSGLPRHVLADLFIWASDEYETREAELANAPAAA